MIHLKTLFHLPDTFEVRVFVRAIVNRLVIELTKARIWRWRQHRAAAAI
jgi:hypothetical protein